MGPHILTTRSKFQKCKLRIFFLSNKSKGQLEKEVLSMQELLEKFRIEFQDVIVLNDATKAPAKLTKDAFTDMITIPVRANHKISTSSQESTTSVANSEISTESIESILSETELKMHA